MARLDSQQSLHASILDRIIDPDSDGTASRPGCTVEQMIDSVRRDLEDLLNTHRTVADIRAEFPQVDNSIITYGMPDLSSYQSTKADVRGRVGGTDRAGHRPVRAPAQERPCHRDRGA